LKDFHFGGNAKRNQLTFGTFKFQHGPCDSLLIYQWIKVPNIIVVKDIDGQEWEQEVSPEVFAEWDRQKKHETYCAAHELWLRQADQYDKALAAWYEHHNAQPPLLS